MSPAARPGPRTIREPVQLSEPAHDVARALKEVMHAFRTIMEGEMRSRGEALSFAHAMLMMSLAREPGLSGAQAARRSQVTAQTMNGLLRNLESAGYAVREPNPENRHDDNVCVPGKWAGNSNRGHDGAAYGTDLPPADKDAIVEYLKTF